MTSPIKKGQALSAAQQQGIISTYADFICSLLPGTLPESGRQVLTSVLLPGKGAPEFCYFSGLNQDGTHKDPRIGGMPLVMIIQGARTETGGYNPDLLPGGKSALDLINEAEGVRPGSLFLEELYRCRARLIHKWNPATQNVSVVLVDQDRMARPHARAHARPRARSPTPPHIPEAKPLRPIRRE